MVLTVDTRAATEYGVVRTFGQAEFQFQNFGTTDPVNSVGNVPDGPQQALLSSQAAVTSRSISIYPVCRIHFRQVCFRVRIALAGYPGQYHVVPAGWPRHRQRANNIQYTAEFGNGVSASIGLDDPRRVELHGGLQSQHPRRDRRQRHRIERLWRPSQSPDIVGRLRVDQAWGLFQISAHGALVNATYNTLAAGCGAEQPVRNQRPPRQASGVVR